MLHEFPDTEFGSMKIKTSQILILVLQRGCLCMRYAPIWSCKYSMLNVPRSEKTESMYVSTDRTRDAMESVLVG